ncbi:MAG TPA: M1 family aminopeptidase [Rhodanobacteraceae bacterium]
MFKEIFGFELRQQFRTPTLWIFLVLFFAGGFAFISSPAVSAAGATGNVFINAPIVIVRTTNTFAFYATLFVVTFIASALLRDFEHNTSDLLFSTPVTRRAYLGGRFAAGFAVAVLVLLAAMFGMLLGTFMPWINAARVGPTLLAPWLWSFAVLALPNMLLVAAVVFCLAAVTRSLFAVFVGVIALLALQIIAGLTAAGIHHHVLGSLIDPYGGATIHTIVRYWSAHAFNTQLPSLSGVLLGNRLIWLAVSVALLIGGALMFRPDREGLRIKWWPRRRRKVRHDAVPTTLTLPAVTARHGIAAHWVRFVSTTRTDMVGVLRGVLFPLMLLLGLAILSVILALSGKVYGTPVYPLTRLMITNIQGAMGLFLLIVLIFFAGELVWRDRKLGVNAVSDATPAPSWVSLLSKGASLALITLIFLAAGAIWTIGYQLIEGYTHLQIGLYIEGLGLAAIGFVLIALLGLVLHVLADNKYLGYGLFIAYLLATPLMAFLDWNDNLYRYGGGPSTPYSDLNGWGHFLTGAMWFNLYWALGAGILLAVATLFWVRGTDGGKRWRNAGKRVRRRTQAITLAVLVVAFAATGSWIYYNTHVLNTYVTRDQAKQDRADYEKLYAKYADAPQPRITAVDSKVAIYPHQRKLAMQFDFTLTNKTAKPIDTLYVNWDQDNPPTHVTFPAHRTLKNDTRLGFGIYRLDQPLAPGATMHYRFDVDYAAHGFGNSLSAMDMRLVHNGTFLTSNVPQLPTFGYNKGFQLTSKKDRRKYGLKPEPRMPLLSEDPAKRANTYIAQDADWISFNTVVSTAGDQTAIAPGQLMKHWQKDGRNYYHYQTHAPVMDFFAFLSGKWTVKREKWHDVTVSVYYNPAHAWNVNDMLRAAHDALDYYTTHFGPYQFKYLRIIEFPAFDGAFAQSFPGTVAFSESAGFIAKLGGKGSIDYPYYITSHEIAHQWWAHQVVGANMQGATVLSESLAQYSALMVMKHRYGSNAMRRFLKYELDNYLRQRVADSNGETPLGKVENQPYIHYRKASVIFYALQDYIGEDKLDQAIRTFLDTYRFKEPPYPTSLDLINDIKAVAGPQWNELINDSFWRITLYDNRVVSAKAKKLADGKYQVTMKLHAAKYYADAKGKQTRAKLNLPIAIGVFGKARDGVEGDEPVLYLKKQKVADGDSTITLTVDAKPYQVGIDPYNELVDKNSADNRALVSW